MAIDKIRPRKLNATADSRLRKADEMQDALNLVSANDFRAEGDTTEGNDGTGNAGVLKPTRGTFEVPPFDSLSTMIPKVNSSGVDIHKRALGSVTDHAHNVVYFFVWCSEAIYQGVYAYDPTGYLPMRIDGVVQVTAGDETYKKVFASALFNFPSDGFIKADLVHVNKPLTVSTEGELDTVYETQPVLYFTDNTNEPRKVHAFRALTEDFTNYALVDINDFITVCPKTPLFPITATFERDDSDSTSSFEGLPGFQFAYQHIYKGGEESSLSTFSDIAIPQAYYQQGSSSSADLYANNRCVLTIPSLIEYNVFSDDVTPQKVRTEEIAEVRILRRVGNTGTWATIEELPVSELEANDNKYNFYNRSIAAGFPPQMAIKPYDNVPQKAEAQAVVSDRLMYGNYVEGYNNVKVTAKASVQYHKRPQDFKELEIYLTPTLRFVGSAASDVGDNVGGQINKRAGYHIDTTGFPSTVEVGTVVQMDFSIRPNRNFHIYNSDNSFHGSRHLSIQDVPQDDGSNDVLGGAIKYPEVYGLEATEEETRGSVSTNKDMNHMFGKNKGVGDGLGLKWFTVASQQGDILSGGGGNSEVEGVFGTSAANPFILRGNSLHFSVKLEAKRTFSGAAAVLRRILTTLLTNHLTDQELGAGLLWDDFLTAAPIDDFGSQEDEGDQTRVKVLEVKSRSSYQINEGLSGHNAGTSSVDAVDSTSQIPVSHGGDDRKHLIVSVGDGLMVNSEASDDDLIHLSPIGYFIVNRADVTFGFLSQDSTSSDGFLELDIKSLNNIDILSAVPFIDAEKWKDSWYESAYDNNNAQEDPYDEDSPNLKNNNPRNWGLRDATLWSLDSLIVDSWYCYSRDYMQGASFSPKIYTPQSSDFPRYMNNSNVADIDGRTGLLAGDLNPNVTNNGRGKNVATLNIGDHQDRHFGGDESINPMYAIRWNPLLFKAFKQSHLMPYFQVVEIDQLHASPVRPSLANMWKYGRHRVLGFLTGIENDDILNLDPNRNYSLVDGAIGPGSTADGSENIRKVSGGDTNYAVGSVTGEMIFTGRIAPRGYFRPEMPKTGKRQSSGLSNVTGYDNWFHQYGQGGVLPYLGGIGYQKYTEPDYGPSEMIANLTGRPFSDRSVGFIHNWNYLGQYTAGSSDDDADDDGITDLDDSSHCTSYVNLHDEGTGTLFKNQHSRYLGDPRWNDDDGSNEDVWDIVDTDNDLKSSARIRDAEIGLTGREFAIFGGGDWDAGGRSFKTRANHAFGIVYYDERGRSGKVNPITFSSVTQGGNGSMDEFIESPTASLGVYVKGYSPSERSTTYNGRASVTIDLEGVTPPDWAHHFQIVYGGNTTKGSFIQYTTGGAFVASKNTSEEGGEEGEDPNSTNVYVSLNYLQGNKDVSYAEAFGAVSSAGTKNLYIHKPGDKLRVLAYYRKPDERVWVENMEFDITGVETVSNNPNSNVFRRAFELSEDSNVVADCRAGQFLVLKNNVKAEGFNYSSVKAGGNSDQTTSHLWNNLCVVEIYSPAKQTDVEDRLFYETGEVYSIRKDPDTGELLHHNSLTDSERIVLNKGDVWFKPVAMAAADYGLRAYNEDGDSLTSYLKFKNLIRKGVKDGESSPRFKNYFVESMTFNDSFAGNNVTSKGKPNTVDKDISRTRKGSSVIFSDKQDFAKRKLSFPSFNGTAKNWKDLPGEFGNINFLQNNYDSLICLQENKSSTIPVERNILTDASGGNTLMTSSKVVGVQAFFAGEYGCDNNPEAVVKNDAATYFASKAKSEVYRLTSQGVQVISKEGMSSYFFRIFEEVKKAKADGEGKVYIPGGYDPLKDEFLITVSNLKWMHTNGALAVSQGNWGDTTPIIYGCMNSASISFNEFANVAQVSADDDSDPCVWPPPVEGCMDPCSTTWNHNAEISDPSACAYFDLCSFDYFSESPDGIVTAEDIAYCYENVLYPSAVGMGEFGTSAWEGLTPLQITQLGWEYGWILRQSSVVKNSFNNPTGGSFCTEGGQYYDIPTTYPLADFNGSVWQTDMPVNGWDFSDAQHMIWFTLGFLQQIETENGGPVTCNIYGCADPMNDEYNALATHHCHEAPDVWTAIREWHLNNPSQDVEDIPWEECSCGDADGPT